MVAQKIMQDARFRALIELSEDGIALSDRVGTTLYLSPAARKILGLGAEEGHGLSVFGAMHPDDRDQMRASREKLLERPGASDRIEGRLLRVDGSCCWIEGTRTNMLDDPAVGAIVANFRDVSNRKHSLDALRASEARYRHIVETTNEGVCLIDGQARTTFVNTRLAVMLQCNVVELVGRHILEFVAPASRLDVSKQITHQEPGTLKPIESLLLRKDGSTLAVLYESVHIFDVEGRHEGCLAMVRDISEHQKSREALRVSEARFLRLSESGIIGITFSTVEGRLCDANEAFLKLIGYHRADLRNGMLDWTTLIPLEHARSGVLAQEQLQTTGIALPWETELVRKDGGRVPVLLGVAMLDPPNCIGFVADLSERKRVEESLANTEAQLRQAQKMEAVGRLAGGIAHDFNNLLTVVLGYNDMAIADLCSGDPLIENLGEVRKAGERAAELTRQLLAFSRQQVLMPKVVRLSDVLQGMERMLARLVGEDIELVVSPTGAAGSCCVDPGQMEQVIMNLVVNARDAMPRGGKLTLETTDIDLGEAYVDTHLGARSGPHVVISVSDNGTGMDEATRARIFEPFFTTKEVGKGTGLGLSTVHGIVQQSGGSVWVYSEPGVGSTFKVYLPRVPGIAEVVPTPKVEPAGGGSETILLVEDEDMVRGVTRNILRRAGYRVMEARCARDALRLSEECEGAVNLLLTDVVMPETSGPELARALVLLRPTMKVLFMSGYTDDSIVRHGVLEAGVAFLQKPLSPSSLSRKVREVLDAPMVRPS